MTLDLSSRKLTNIPNFNDISVVKSYGFNSADEIIRLYLGTNQIRKIECLDSLVNLHYLDLDNNYHPLCINYLKYLFLNER